MNTRQFLLVSTFVAASCFGGTARAAQDSGIVTGPPGTEDHWEWTVAPYLWMFGMDGNLRVRNTSADVNVGFDDIVNNLDIAAMVSVEARKGPFGLYLDPLYGKLSAEGKSGPINVDVETELFLVDFGTRYRVLDSRTDEGRARVVDLSLGGRYMYTSNELDFAVLADRDKSGDFVDLTVGARYAMDVTERFGLLAGGDVGGFGIGTSSEFSWNAQLLACWSFRRAGVLWAGYRVLDIDQDDGGSSGYDLQISGPLVGYEFRF